MIAYQERVVMENGNGRQKEYLTVSEVAKRWGVTVRTVKNRINAGKVQAIQISERGDKRIALSEVERFEREIIFKP